MRRTSVRRCSTNIYSGCLCWLLMLFFAMRLNSLCVISVRFGQRWERREDPPHRPLQPAAQGPRPASKTRFVSTAQTSCSQSAQQTVIMIPAFVLVQIVGPAAPCPGLPPLTAVSWLPQCRPRPPTRWDDSSSPPHLSHRVSRQLILIYYQIWLSSVGASQYSHSQYLQLVSTRER